jgi:hypothetical protein
MEKTTGKDRWICKEKKRSKSTEREEETNPEPVSISILLSHQPRLVN